MATRWVAAAGAAVVLSGVAHAQVALSSSFNLGVHADANQHAAGYSQDTDAQSQGGTLNPYSGSLSVTSFDPVNSGRFVTVSSAASASWIDAGHGSVAWRNMGWSHNTVESSAAKINGLVTNQPVWSYTFQATQRSVFSLDYDVRGTGSTFGLLGVKILWSGPGGNLDLTDSFNPDATGIFTRNMLAGETYTVGLYNMSNVFTSPLLNTTTGNLEADFNWSVSAVPEPATFAALSLGALVLVRRRRR